jgi:hypothetical protein
MTFNHIDILSCCFLRSFVAKFSSTFKVSLHTRSQSIVSGYNTLSYRLVSGYKTLSYRLPTRDAKYIVLKDSGKRAAASI